MTDKWHALAAAEVPRQLKSDGASGLPRDEARRRAADAGPNELPEHSRLSAWRILGRQFRSVLVLMLIAAAVLSAALGDLKDTLAILVMVMLNTLLGFQQEHQAERAVAALKRLAAPMVRVRRPGGVETVPARELVPGDVVLLEAGNLVPADCRVLETNALRVQESMLTGETEAVEKSADAVLDATTAVADRVNMAHMGTSVVAGRGVAIVTGTGAHTELGRIAALLGTVQQEQTPLQKLLDNAGRKLALLALALVSVIFAIGWMRGEPVQQLLLLSISLAVAAVPEGLPAVVTIALALASQRMLKRNALVRRLTAVETLGSVTVICTDKTGTLTQNRMTAVRAFAGGRMLDLQGDAREAAVELLLTCGALCNDAVRAERGWAGDPTETALAEAADRLALRKEDLEHFLPRQGEIPFDSNRKCMTTIHAVEDAAMGARLGVNARYVAFIKGSVEGVLERSRHADGASILAANEALGGQGMRVLALAMRPLDDLDVSANVERDLVFLGLIGLMDPPRPEARAAVATCKAAGIRPVMITGDHASTAAHIAADLGISADRRVITGAELRQLDNTERRRVIAEISIFARVAPEDKLALVEALQQSGEIVAMTGDGVNDGPALKKADIGIAMGGSGTDVAREAAALVLRDDNFATIVAAVQEGRAVYDNMRKFIRYLLCCNSGELWVMLAAPILGMPLPLLPLQILWMNLITDGLPALALGLEPAERDVMARPPRPRGESILDRRTGFSILRTGLVLGSVPLAAGFWLWSRGSAEWQTVIFVILTLGQLFLAWGHRSGRGGKALLAALAFTFALQGFALYTPAGQALLNTRALGAGTLIACLALSLVPLATLVKRQQPLDIAQQRRDNYGLDVTSGSGRP